MSGPARHRPRAPRARRECRVGPPEPGVAPPPPPECGPSTLHRRQSPGVPCGSSRAPDQWPKTPARRRHSRWPWTPSLPTAGDCARQARVPPRRISQRWWPPAPRSASRREYVRNPTDSKVILVTVLRASHLESFLRGHVEVFDALGGIARALMYDNLRSAVLDRRGAAVLARPPSPHLRHRTDHRGPRASGGPARRHPPGQRPHHPRPAPAPPFPPPPSSSSVSQTAGRRYDPTPPGLRDLGLRRSPSRPGATEAGRMWWAPAHGLGLRTGRRRHGRATAIDNVRLYPQTS